MPEPASASRLEENAQGSSVQEVVADGLSAEGVALERLAQLPGDEPARQNDAAELVEASLPQSDHPERGREREVQTEAPAHTSAAPLEARDAAGMCVFDGAP